MPKKTKKFDLKQMSEGFPLIGWCVHWSVHELDTSFIEFTESLVKAGIDPSIARKTLPRNAFIRAMKTISKGAKDQFHKKLAERDDLMAMAVVGMNVDDSTEDFDAQFKTPTKAVYDKDQKSIKVKGEHSEAVQKMYEAFQERYTATQFRSVILRYVKRECDGVTVRDGGGVYFIPEKNAATLEKLQVLMDQFPACTLELIPIVDTQQARKSMWRATIGEIKSNIKKLQEDFSGLDDEIKERSLDIRLEKYKALREKVEMYEDVLHGTADELKESLNELTKQIKKKVLA